MAEARNQSGADTPVSSALSPDPRSYWRLALPALGTRYIARYIQNVAGFKDNRLFDAAAGIWMLGVTGYYAYRAESDLKKIFSETVAYEGDKNPCDVGIRDLLKSTNKAVISTHKKFAFDTALRTVLNASFFACFLPWKRLQKVDSVDLGVGLNGAYMVSEILERGSKAPFFDQLRQFIGNKIDQANSLGDNIRANDLMQLYERYATENDPQNALSKQSDSKIWKQNQIMFERMAQLMNHTYQRQYSSEKADFKMSKFLYILGHDLIQPEKPEQTLVYIEIANTYGIAALKKVVKSVDEGKELTHALQNYPLPTTISTSQPATLFETDKNTQVAGKESSQPGKKHVDGLHPDSSRNTGLRQCPGS